ncbi:MAG: hypothetical protein ACI9MC_000350 [Kiritimatiellia bacterium]|jgi:hypothetical protein
MACILFVAREGTATGGPSHAVDTLQRSKPNTETDPEPDTETDPEPAQCAPQMVVVNCAFCIYAYQEALEEVVDGEWAPVESYDTINDRDERATPAHGMTPQGYISGLQAQAACRASGKRLRTSDEWLLPGAGPQGFTWPYGDVYKPDARNDS